MSFDGKTILVTGGAGSFGQKFVELVLKEHNPRSIRVYDHAEGPGVELERKLRDSRLRFFVGDVRDRSRLHRAMYKTDIVVHAAALKHIPVCEYDPIEAIKTNVEGAVNVIDEAIENGVPKVMNISTDKAVHPINLYGATKMVAEKLFVQGNSYSIPQGVRMSSARYGNVIASSGSVIPLFQEQKEKGELTITDERMTRFWMSLEQGVRFVISSIERTEGGEIFVPKPPSMKVSDVADVIAPEVPREVTGIRPGEKLHEELLTEEEARHTKDFGEYFVIEPEFSFWNGEKVKDGKPLPEGFFFRSDQNSQWITKEQMAEVLKKGEFPDS